MPDTTEQIETGFNPPADAGEVVMTRAEVARSRKPGLRELLCRVLLYGYYGYDKRWMNTGGCSPVPTKSEACLSTVDEGLRRTGDSLTLFYIEDPNNILGTRAAENSQLPTDDGKPKRKCQHRSYLDSQLVSMLKVSPTNETFRARLMARMGEMPPEDCDTFEKLVDWVEFNFPKSGGHPPKVEPKVITVSVDYSERQSGRCKFSRTESGSGRASISADEIKEIAAGSSDFEEIMAEVRQQIEEYATGNFSTNYSAEEYDEFEVQDSDEAEFDYNNSVLESAVRSLLESELSASELDDLGMS